MILELFYYNRSYTKLKNNFYLNREDNNLTIYFLSKDKLIKDESQLANLNDVVAIDKKIRTLIVNHNDTKLRNDVDGNEYKEVVK